MLEMSEIGTEMSLLRRELGLTLVGSNYLQSLIGEVLCDGLHIPPSAFKLVAHYYNMEVLPQGAL